MKHFETLSAKEVLNSLTCVILLLARVTKCLGKKNSWYDSWWSDLDFSADKLWLPKEAGYLPLCWLLTTTETVKVLFLLDPPASLWEVAKTHCSSSDALMGFCGMTFTQQAAGCDWSPSWQILQFQGLLHAFWFFLPIVKWWRGDFHGKKWAPDRAELGYPCSAPPPWAELLWFHY